MKSRVKVSTDALLAAVKARRDAIVSDHAKAVAVYEAKMAKLAPKIAEALETAASATRDHLFPEIHTYRRSEVHIYLKFQVPSKPEDKPNTYRIDRLIRTLEMAAEPTIGISADDAAQYLG